jgi:Zn-dependent protease
MFRSFRLGRAFGIPLYLHPSFFLLPLLVLFMSRGEGAVRVALALAVLFAIFGCVLLHELGHALTARLFGVATRDITLYPIGGVARLEGMGSRPSQEVAIAVAGPAVNLVIFLLLMPATFAALATGLVGGEGDPIGAGGSTPLGFAAHFLTMLCFGNLGLLLFNMIPAFPMDGGRVLRALLSLGMGRLDATRIAAALGLVLAGGLAVFAIFAWLPQLLFVAGFVAFAGQMELLAMKQLEARRQARMDAEIPDALPVEPDDRPLGADPHVGGFTGVAWDARRGTWVRWVNGRMSDQ